MADFEFKDEKLSVVFEDADMVRITPGYPRGVKRYKEFC